MGWGVWLRQCPGRTGMPARTRCSRGIAEIVEEFDGDVVAERGLLDENNSATLKSSWLPCPASWTSGRPPGKIDLIDSGSMNHVSAIRLIRTDTTLDLSQKAEKGMPAMGGVGHPLPGAAGRSGCPVMGAAAAGCGQPLLLL